MTSSVAQCGCCRDLQCGTVWLLWGPAMPHTCLHCEPLTLQSEGCTCCTRCCLACRASRQTTGGPTWCAASTSHTWCLTLSVSCGCRHYFWQGLLLSKSRMVQPSLAKCLRAAARLAETADVSARGGSSSLLASSPSCHCQVQTFSPGRAECTQQAACILHIVIVMCWCIMHHMWLV